MSTQEPGVFLCPYLSSLNVLGQACPYGADEKLSDADGEELERAFTFDSFCSLLSEGRGSSTFWSESFHLLVRRILPFGATSSTFYLPFKGKLVLESRV
jgi:hypothetical protein